MAAATRADLAASQGTSPERRDAASVLHPYTQLRRLEREGALVLSHGDGVWVYDQDGKGYIEGLSGLWCASLGFGEKRLVEAAIRQLETLPFYHSFAQKSHEPMIALAEALLALAPVPMARAMFANSGSEAIDSAIKLIWYYNNARGRPEKKKLISRQRAYHGVTVAAGSLTALPAIQKDFDLPIARVLQAACPYAYRFAQPGESEEDFATRLAESLDAQIRAEGPETVAAFFAEPVMGAGGVLIPPATYFDKIQAVLRTHDVLLVADEVITGFGRLGYLWGCEAFGIKPDLLVTAKALSSAYQPISAVLVSDPIYQVIADHSARLGTFGHGFTYSGHPVAAAVALETLRLYRERDIVGHVQAVGPRLQEGLQALAADPLIGEVRGMGLVAAVELVQDKASRTPFDPARGIGAKLAAFAQDRGLIVRPLPNDIVAFAPPLIIEPAEIDLILERFTGALADMNAWLQAGN